MLNLKIFFNIKFTFTTYLKYGKQKELGLNIFPASQMLTNS